MKKFFSKIWGYILFGVAKFLDFTLGNMAKGITFLVNKIKKLFGSLLSSCSSTIFMFFIFSFLLRFIAPFLRLLLRPWIVMIFFAVVVVLFLGSFFEYWHYVLSGYLYDKSEDFIKGTSKSRVFSSYGQEYYRQKEAKKEAERQKKYAEEQAQREERRKQQEEYWGKIFEEFFRGFTGGTYTNYGGTGRSGQSGGSYNPTFDFRKKYRESCDALGLSYDTTEEEVKTSYRNLAKKYHPDLNNSPGATTKFQEISNAYDFLSKENIERYQRLNRM